MTQAIEYQNLNGEDLAARFDRDGSVSVRLAEQHAGACVALIDTCVSAYSMKGAGFARRTWMVFLGWWVAGRVTLFHSRLMELTTLLVLRQAQYRVTQESDGKVFHFERRSV